MIVTTGSNFTNNNHFKNNKFWNFGQFELVEDMHFVDDTFINSVSEGSYLAKYFLAIFKIFMDVNKFFSRKKDFLLTSSSNQEQIGRVWKLSWNFALCLM